MGERPFGVTLVGVLMVIGALGNFLFSGFLLALCSVGGPPSHPGVSPLLSLLFFTPILLSLISFIVSIRIFNRGKYAWHLSILFWVTSPIYYVSVTRFLSSGVNLLSTVAVFIIVVNTAFIIHFQLRQVKDYFAASAGAQLDAKP
jgi:hypothetical protein